MPTIHKLKNGTYEDTLCGVWPEKEDIVLSPDDSEVSCPKCLKEME